jgi:TolB-like protein
VTENNVLDSWKEISRYLDKKVRTCIRWENKLGLPVRRIDSQSTRSRVFAYKSEIDQWLKQRTNGHQLRRTSFFLRKSVMAGALFLAGGLVVLFLVRPFAISTGAASAGPGRLVKIAVFPFVDGDGAEYDKYLSVSLTQEIVDCLQRHEGIAIIPLPPLLTAVPPAKPEQIGRELGLDYFLKGEIRREKDRASLAIKFVKAGNDELIWSSKYQEPLDHLWTIKNDISSNIGQKLHRGENPEGEVRASAEGPNNGQALDSYFKGNFILSRLNGESNDPWILYHQGKFYESKYSAGDNELAISLFRQAISLDQSYGPAYVGLATCYANFVNFSWDFNVLWLDRAEELLAKALAWNPDLPGYFSTSLEVLLLRDSCFGQDRGKRIAALAEAGLKKYPNDQQLNSIVGTYHFHKYGKEGQPEDWQKAVHFKERSFWLNPYALSNIVYAELLLLNKDYDRALEVCSLLGKIDTSNLAKFQSGEIYYYLDDLDKSEAIFKSFEVPTKFRLISLFYLGMIHARRGEQKEALKNVEEISLLSPGEYRYFDDRLKLASIYLGLGRVETGYEYLQSFFHKDRSIRERYIRYRYIELDKNFDKFRKDGKFLEILNRKEPTLWLRARPSA